MNVIIQQNTYDKIMYWINKTDKEVGGFGKVIYNKEDKTFRIVDAYLLNQEVGSATTDIDADALCDLMVDTFRVEGELKWWWHSHVDMAVFWSGTDKETIKEIGSQGWCLATVFNKKFEMRSALGYANEVFGTYEFADNLDTEIEQPDLDENMVKVWDDEYTAKVRDKKYGTSFHYSGGYQGDLWDSGTQSWKKPVQVANNVGHLVPESTVHHTDFANMDGYGVPSIDDDDYAYPDHGYLGYGLRDEARALGMTPKALAKIILYGSHSEIEKIDEKLLRLEKKGVFNVGSRDVRSSNPSA